MLCWSTRYKFSHSFFLFLPLLSLSLSFSFSSRNTATAKKEQTSQEQNGSWARKNCTWALVAMAVVVVDGVLWWVTCFVVFLTQLHCHKLYRYRCICIASLSFQLSIYAWFSNITVSDIGWTLVCGSFSPLISIIWAHKMGMNEAKIKWVSNLRKRAHVPGCTCGPYKALHCIPFADRFYTLVWHCTLSVNFLQHTAYHTPWSWPCIYLLVFMKCTKVTSFLFSRHYHTNFIEAGETTHRERNVTLFVQN